jgi:hypothetical protein
LNLFDFLIIILFEWELESERGKIWKNEVEETFSEEVEFNDFDLRGRIEQAGFVGKAII